MKTRPLGNQKGFTLIEMLIASAVAVLVIGGVFSAYLTMKKSSDANAVNAEMQQNVRTTLDTINRMLTMAGYQGGCNESHDHGFVYQIDYGSGPVTATGDNSVAFTYWDEDPAFVPISDCTKERRIRIYRSGDQVLAQMEGFKPSQPGYVGAGPGTTPVVIANHITNLKFTYYDAKNAVINHPDGTNITTIRKVNVTVTGEGSLKDLFLGGKRKFSLSSDVKPVNMGIEGHAVDTVPPIEPGGLHVTDPYECTKLAVSWTANTEADLAGYTLFWGVGSGNYDHRVELSAGATSYTIDGDNVLVRGILTAEGHYIALAARDTSGNMSDVIEVHTDGSNDTKPDPDKPQAGPPNLQATSGPGQITLTWSQCSDADVVKYRVYRKPIYDKTSITPWTIPNPASTYGVTQLVNDGTFSSKVSFDGTRYTFVDTTGLLGCVMYDYLIEPVNCDTSLTSFYTTAQYSRIYGNGSDMGYPRISSSVVTVPTDATPPGSPINLVGIPGANCVYLSWTNPPDEDFDGIMIRRSTSAFPASPTEGLLVVNDTTHTKDASVAFKDDGLDNDVCYYYTAFAYDKCTNYSAGIRGKNSEGQVEPACSRPCGDGIPNTAQYGDPPAPPTNSYTASYCSGSVNLGWSDASVLLDDGSYGLPTDVTGYNVYRGASRISTSYKGGGTLNVYRDTDINVTDGGIYTYNIRTVDCAGNLSPSGDARYITAYPGKVYYEAKNATLSLGKYHNILQFETRNSSAYQAKVNGMTLTWRGANTETNAWLTVIWYYNGSSWVQIYSGPGKATGDKITFSTPLYLNAATNVDSPSVTQFRFVWKNASGTVTTLDDMRNSDVTIQYDYRLFYSIGTSATDPSPAWYESNPDLVPSCGVQIYDVARPYGPTFMDVTQNQPVAGTYADSTVGTIYVTQDAQTDVSAFVTDTSIPLAGLKYCKLFYAVTDRTVVEPPQAGDPPDDINRKTDLNQTGFTCITTIPVNTGDYVQYKTQFLGSGRPIPANNNKRVWYFLLAEDNNGNFKRSPTVTDPDKLYNYDQLSAGSGGSSTTVAASIADPAAGSTVGGTVTVRVAATSSGSGLSNVTIRIDGGLSKGCAFNMTSGYWEYALDTSAMANGSHTITAQATTEDLHSATASVTFTVNNAATTVNCQIVSPTGGTVGGTVPIKLQATTNGPAIDSAEVSVDGGTTWQPCTLSGSYYVYNWDTTLAADGNYYIKGRATSGTTTGNATDVLISVDNSVVNVSIVSPASGSVLSGGETAQVLASAGSGSISTVQVSWDNATWTTCNYNSSTGYYEATLVINPPRIGETWTLYAKATSMTGNTGTATATYCVDTTQLLCEITDPAGGATINGPSHIIKINAATTGSAVASVSVSIDGGAGKPALFDSLTGLWVYTWNLTSADSNRSHTITATATATSSACRTLTATGQNTVNVGDSTPPAVTVTKLTYGSSGLVNNPGADPTVYNINKGTTVKWWLSVTDASTPLTVTVDYNQVGNGITMSYDAGSGQYYYQVALPNGANKSCTFIFHATDSNGNTVTTAKYKIST